MQFNFAGLFWNVCARTLENPKPLDVRLLSNDKPEEVRLPKWNEQQGNEAAGWPREGNSFCNWAQVLASRIRSRTRNWYWIGRRKVWFVLLWNHNRPISPRQVDTFANQRENNREVWQDECLYLWRDIEVVGDDELEGCQQLADCWWHVYDQSFIWFSNCRLPRRQHCIFFQLRFLARRGGEATSWTGTANREGSCTEHGKRGSGPRAKKRRQQRLLDCDWRRYCPRIRHFCILVYLLYLQRQNLLLVMS